MSAVSIVLQVSVCVCLCVRACVGGEGHLLPVLDVTSSSNNLSGLVLGTLIYGGPGGRATKHCTTSDFLIEQYSDGPIPCSAAVRFCDRSDSAIKRSSTSATALTSIDLFLGSNNGLYLGSNNGLFLRSNNGLFLRSNSGPFLRPTSQTYYGMYRWYLA